MERFEIYVFHRLISDKLNLLRQIDCKGLHTLIFFDQPSWTPVVSPFLLENKFSQTAPFSSRSASFTFAQTLLELSQSDYLQR